ncbi:MAG: GCN5-related N-acetyltransferase [Sporomusa sp.]|jgi:N-acetylglutamate synthase-like GNAT family acetyltransferase|nr:GCN5-related N-acetyltransferase [Sporomusa sp.]
MYQQDDYTISTDKFLLDFDVIHKFISCDSYWGIGRSQEVMRKAIDNSALCFGVYHGEKQIGFARVISDLATFGYLADVFILSKYRGLGLGKWLIHTIVNHPDLVVLKRIILFTRTPEFYYDAGFNLFDQANEFKFMERKDKL